ncbi:hypothetical protein OU995_16610 [Roseateles sp. SL47]|uniref:hypothetical protein n=1 Tax=Roseateles sp. SL47 TaxID=2995138 RepID=UPI0022722AE8|nr:hypothetical protein [Roseateles sp. SL47]WAC71211.1 hypothetical protein OU995_16610 [Roseateles sp. SL47]
MSIEYFFGEHSFALLPFNEADEALECFAYPGYLPDRWMNGASIRFDAAPRASWVGHFLSGRESPNAVSFCCDHPDGVHALVIAGGIAYQVAPANPADWIELPIRPVMGGCASASANAVALFDYSRMLVLYADGDSWTSAAVSWDGLKNVRERNGVLFGDGWDAAENEPAPFEVDLRTRRTLGGAAPPSR